MTAAAGAHELASRVRQVAEGTPYVVHETDSGFDVTLDIVDATWFGLFNKASLTRVYVHHVAVPEPGVYTVTDESRTVEWVAGVPSAGSAERVHGRVKELGAQKVWALDEHGRFGVQADYRFGSEEGRDLVAGVARELGFTRRRGTAERVGLIVGVIGGVGALVAVVAVVVAGLLGKF